MFVADSDHLSILQRQGPAAGYRNLANRLAAYSARHFFVTIVSFHEQVNGWTAYVARARDSAGLAGRLPRTGRHPVILCPCSGTAV